MEDSKNLPEKDFSLEKENEEQTSYNNKKPSNLAYKEHHYREIAHRLIFKIVKKNRQRPLQRFRPQNTWISFIDLSM